MSEQVSFSLSPTVLVLICVCIVALAVFISWFVRNPFKYPYFIYEFNVSRKRNVVIEDYIDRYISDPNNWEKLQDHQKVINKWKEDSKHYLSRCLFKNHRIQQYDKVLDDENAYRFGTYRDQTRYRQKNYVKTAYKVQVSGTGFCASWSWLYNRYNLLSDIDFACTLREYHSKNQRKLMTKALRQQIMERDNYTCQICGKYMPDEVGLHIDHIVPVSKGGKTVPSNLQVLCSKCNGGKSAKY